MKTLSISEAQQYFNTINPREYLFTTVNQQETQYLHNVSIVSRYEKMLTSRFTKQICFKDGADTLCFSGVKYIKVDETHNSTVPFYIVCSDTVSETGESEYKLIAEIF